MLYKAHALIRDDSGTNFLRAKLIFEEVIAVELPEIEPQYLWLSGDVGLQPGTFF